MDQRLYCRLHAIVSIIENFILETGISKMKNGKEASSNRTEQRAVHHLLVNTSLLN